MILASIILEREMRCTGSRMAHYDHVHLHGQDIIDGIQKCFPFLDGGRRGGKVNHVGRQALFSQFEGDPGACGILKKQVGDRHIAQGRHFFDRPVNDILKIVGSTEDQTDVPVRSGI